MLRVHLKIFYKNTSINSPSFGRYGLIVENDDAIAAGAHLDPIADSDGPWLHNDFIHADQGDLKSFQDQVDIRAHRLIKPKFSLEFVLDIDSASNSTMDWGVGMRVLLEHR